MKNEISEVDYKHKYMKYKIKYINNKINGGMKNIHLVNHGKYILLTDDKSLNENNLSTKTYKDLINITKNINNFFIEYDMNIYNTSLRDCEIKSINIRVYVKGILPKENSFKAKKTNITNGKRNCEGYVELEYSINKLLEDLCEKKICTKEYGNNCFKFIIDIPRRGYSKVTKVENNYMLQ